MCQTVKEIEINVAYRWFLGLDRMDKVLHFSTFGKNYTRRFKDTDLFEQIFSHILQECYEFKLIDLSEVFVDATHVVSARICTKSGMLPVPEVCDACIQTEYFARGTIPSKYCDIHISELVCAESGQLATSQCGMVEMRTIELIPLDTQDSTSSLGGRRLTYPTCSLHPEVMTTQTAPTEPTE